MFIERPPQRTTIIKEVSSISELPGGGYETVTETRTEYYDGPLNVTRPAVTSRHVSYGLPNVGNGTYDAPSTDRAGYSTPRTGPGNLRGPTNAAPDLIMSPNFNGTYEVPSTDRASYLTPRTGPGHLRTPTGAQYADDSSQAAYMAPYPRGRPCNCSIDGNRRKKGSKDSNYNESEEPKAEKVTELITEQACSTDDLRLAPDIEVVERLELSERQQLEENLRIWQNSRRNILYGSKNASSNSE